MQRVTPGYHGSDIDDEAQKSLVCGAEEVLERQRAAKALNLQQMEFVAITGETFFSALFGDLLKGMSNDMTLIATILSEPKLCIFWGYGDEDTMLGVVNGLGLSFIKHELLRRSGLESQDILELIKT